MILPSYKAALNILHQKKCSSSLNDLIKITFFLGSLAYLAREQYWRRTWAFQQKKHDILFFSTSKSYDHGAWEEK